MSEAEKRICRRCKKCDYNRGVLSCEGTAKTLTHWSTGEQQVVYDLCDHVNVDGTCSMYVYQPTVWESIKTYLQALNFFNWPGNGPGCHWRSL